MKIKTRVTCDRERPDCVERSGEVMRETGSHCGKVRGSHQSEGTVECELVTCDPPRLPM